MKITAKEITQIERWLRLTKKNRDLQCPFNIERSTDRFHLRCCEMIGLPSDRYEGCPCTILGVKEVSKRARALLKEQK